LSSDFRATIAGVAERGVMQTKKLLRSVIAWGTLVPAAIFLMTRHISAGQVSGEVSVQGRWAYTSGTQEDVTEYMATIQAVEDSTWLLLACSAQKRLAVSLIHDGDFPFPLKPSSHVQMRSNNTAAVSIVGKSIQRNLLFLDPGSLRDSIPLILQDDLL
jgi:hypothetical protein